MTKTAFKFVGPGYHYGVPGRDITVEEFDDLSPRQRRIIVESIAYEPTRAGKDLVPDQVTDKDDKSDAPETPEADNDH